MNHFDLLFIVYSFLINHLQQKVDNFLPCIFLLDERTLITCNSWRYPFSFLVNAFFFFVILFQIPVLFNALGGILVGLVTSRAGGVRKASFTLVFLTRKIVPEHNLQVYEPR